MIELMMDVYSSHQIDNSKTWLVAIYNLIEKVVKTKLIPKVNKLIISVFGKVVANGEDPEDLYKKMKRLASEDSMSEEKGIDFDTYIQLIFENCKLAEIQNDSVYMLSLLEPLSYLWMSDYSQTSQSLSNKIDVVIQQIGGMWNGSLQITADNFSSSTIECWWSIIISAQLVESNSRMLRKDAKQIYELDKPLFTSVFRINKILQQIQENEDLWKKLKLVRRHINLYENSIVKFFGAFSKAYIFRTETPAEVTQNLCKGMCFCLIW